MEQREGRDNLKQQILII